MNEQSLVYIISNGVAAMPRRSKRGERNAGWNIDIDIEIDKHIGNEKVGSNFKFWRGFWFEGINESMNMGGGVLVIYCSVP